MAEKLISISFIAQSSFAFIESKWTWSEFVVVIAADFFWSFVGKPWVMEEEKEEEEDERLKILRRLPLINT